MAQWERNHVHFAFLGRDSLSTDDILKVNGVDQDICAVSWHDARPDYAESSSKLRAQASVETALRHINAFLHPKALISDNAMNEDGFFVKGSRAAAASQGFPIIEIPKDGAERLMWITRLDSGSLNAWNKATVDILIHAPTDSSGSLIRLIKSLQRADYTGLDPPRLIVELPPDIDNPTSLFLKDLVWPPANSGPTSINSGVILRHRIPRSRESTEGASIRFVESYYPANPDHNHVLLLSPQAELSPSYYHYVTYTLLEYKYSSFGSSDSTSLLGISLDLPSSHLNGTDSFKPPTTLDMHDKYHEVSERTNAPFLWQAPNSNAALYFGDRWVEIHSFLSFRTSVQHRQNPPPQRAKIISSSQPSWTEYFLELIRARSYSMLYPAVPSTEAMVTIHNELYQPPEEFSSQAISQNNKDSETSPPPSEDDAAFLAPDSSPPKLLQPELPLIPPSRPLHVILPFAGDLPEVHHLPELSYSGDILKHPEHKTAAEEYAEQFRVEIGGCKPTPKGRKRAVRAGNARDLFCFGDGEDELWEDGSIVGTSDDDAASTALLDR